jgi:hypothetical protein
MRSGHQLALVPACLAILAGCAGNGPPPPASTSSFEAIQRGIFDVHCVSAGCHNASDRADGLVLSEGDAYASLVGVVPANPAAASAGLRRVMPNQPDQSFLLIKLAVPGPGEGSQMPLGAPPMSAPDIESIRAWILAGAPGSDLPTPPASLTPSATPTDTPLPTATATPLATNTLPPLSTPTGTLPATATPTPTLPATATASGTFTPSATPTPAVPPTPTFSTDSTFPQIQATIFNRTCIGLGCHNAQDAAGGQVLEAGQAYASLVGATPINAAAAAHGLLGVEPGHPENSFLIIKLTLPGVFDPQFFSRMPLGRPPLDPAQVDHIRAWILRGALPDESPR